MSSERRKRRAIEPDAFEREQFERVQGWQREDSLVIEDAAGKRERPRLLGVRTDDREFLRGPALRISVDAESLALCPPRRERGTKHVEGRTPLQRVIQKIVVRGEAPRRQHLD